MDIDSPTTEATSLTANPPTRDARYYFSDGVVIFLCQGVLYNLHKTRLSLKSEFFTDMFDVPQSSESGVDGRDDDHPVNLDKSGISNIDFRHLLVFLYDQDEVEETAPLQFFFSVLHLSKMWRISSGIKYATTQLPRHPDFTPAIQIQLSRQYDIEGWADPAFRSLVTKSLTEITLADAEYMGVVAFYKLVQVKAKVAEYKLGMAFNPAEVHHSFGCTDEPQCSRLWEAFWWGGYAKQLLHPDNKKAPAAIMLELDPTKGPVAHMPHRCMENTMEAMWEDNPFNEEQEFVDVASKDLSAWMKSL